MTCFLALHFSVFISSRNSFQINLSHSHISFFTVIFPILLFPTDLPKSNSCFDCLAEPTTQGLRKAALLLPTCAVLITSVACRSDDWYLLRNKQTHLPCCRELERESYCDPHADRVISEERLTRIFLLKEVEDPLSLCFTFWLLSRFCTDSSFRDCFSTLKQGQLLHIGASCSCYWQQECITVWHWCALG